MLRSTRVRRWLVLLFGILIGCASACGKPPSDPDSDSNLPSSEPHQASQNPPLFPVANCSLKEALEGVDGLAKSVLAEQFPGVTGVSNSQFEHAGYTLVTHGVATDLQKEIRPVFRIYRLSDNHASASNELLVLSGVLSEGCRLLPAESYSLKPLEALAPALALKKCDAAQLRREVLEELELIAKIEGHFLHVEIKIGSPRATVLPKLFMGHDEGIYTEVFVSFQTEITPTRPDQDVSNLRNPFNMAAILISNLDCKTKGATQYFKI